MIEGARISSRSSIAVDLKLRGFEGKKAYDISVLNEMKQLLVELSELRDSAEFNKDPKVLDYKSARRVHAFLVQEKNESEQLNNALKNIDWAKEQVDHLLRGTPSESESLSLYLARLSGLLLSIE